MNELPDVLIVDGHSMIFACEELRKWQVRNPAEARRRLLAMLVRYQDNSGCHVVVVFDGRGPKANKDREETRVQVFYSKAGQSADAIIERFVAKYAATHHITVATDDHMERTTVSTFGAYWISSEGLLERMQTAEDSMRETLENLKRKARR